MPCEALCAGNTAAYEHPNVADGSQHSYGTDKKVRPGGIVVLQSRWTNRRFQSVCQLESGNSQDDEKRDPVEEVRPCVPAPGGEPCRCHQIESKSAAQNISRLMLQGRHVHPSCAKAHHRYDKYIASEAMPAGTLAEKHRDKSREHSQSTGRYVKKQYG